MSRLVVAELVVSLILSGYDVSLWENESVELFSSDSSSLLWGDSVAPVSELTDSEQGFSEPDNVVSEYKPRVIVFSPASFHCPACEPQWRRISGIPGAEKRRRDGLGTYPQTWLQKPDGVWVKWTGAVSRSAVEEWIERYRNEEQLDAGEQPTRMEEVNRVIKLLNPRSDEVFVDFGCGDARYCIAAVRHGGGKAIGVEIDPAQVVRARDAVSAAGLSDRIEIIEGDATAVDVDADVGVAYLFPSVLDKLEPKIRKLDRFVSYMHPVKGLPQTNHDGAHYWQKPKGVSVSRSNSDAKFCFYNGKWWVRYGGSWYAGRQCTDKRCGMCNYIARELAKQK